MMIYCALLHYSCNHLFINFFNCGQHCSKSVGPRKSFYSIHDVERVEMDVFVLFTLFFKNKFIGHFRGMAR